MADPRNVQIFLEPGLRESAENGQHNFISKLVNTLQNARFNVEFCDQDEPATGPFSLTHMKEPKSTQGLLFRRVYHYPFWQIEADVARWNWDVAKASFDPSLVEPQEARRFAEYWRRRLFSDRDISRDGYVYVPLQGRLLSRRSFQKCSPVEMIDAVLAHSGNRNVIAGLHPKEKYSAAEIDALERLELKNHRLLVGRGDSDRLLAGCDYVVTQNSGVAYSGYFLRKPALLFAKIDFHHIAVQAEMDDLRFCFDRVADHRPDFAAYVWWFWQQQSTNAGRPDVEQRIAARLDRFGWPMQ